MGSNGKSPQVVDDARLIGRSRGQVSPWEPLGLEVLHGLLEAPTMAWREQASCRWVDPELFFPSKGEEVPAWETKAAKAMCRRCPARLHCLAASIQPLEQGIWGGMSEGERRRLALRVRCHAAQQRPEHSSACCA